MKVVRKTKNFIEEEYPMANKNHSPFLKKMLFQFITEPDSPLCHARVAHQPTHET